MNNEYEREIDLLDLLFFVLEKWKLYVLVGLVALIVLTGYKYYTTEQGRAKNDELIAEGREDEVINSSVYQEALDALDEKERKIRSLEEDVTKRKVDITDYRASISNNNDIISTNRESIVLLEAEQAEIKRKLQELLIYMDNTLLLSIDATAKPNSKKTYQVIYSGEGAESLFRDPVDELLGGYTQNVTLIGAGSGLEEKYGVSEKYLDELFNVWYDSVSNSIFVSAWGTDRQMAEDVCTAVCKMIEDRKKGMTNRYHAHSINVIDESFIEIVDEKLANEQSNRYNMANSYKSQIADYDAQILNTNTNIENLNSANENLEQQIKDANNNISELQDDIVKVKKQIIEDKLEEKVATKAPSKMRSLKDGIKFGLISAIALAIFVAVIYCLIYFMDGKMHTASDLCVTYCIPLLTVLNRTVKKGCFIDTWIYQMRNKGYATPNEEIMKTASVTVTKLIGEAKRVAVLSSLDMASLEKVTSDLKGLITGVEFVPVADSFSSAVNAQELDGVDTVIFYEKREASKIAEIEVELGQVKLLEKGIIGGIIA